MPATQLFANFIYVLCKDAGEAVIFFTHIFYAHFVVEITMLTVYSLLTFTYACYMLKPAEREQGHSKKVNGKKSHCNNFEI